MKETLLRWHNTYMMPNANPVASYILLLMIVGMVVGYVVWALGWL